MDPFETRARQAIAETKDNARPSRAEAEKAVRTLIAWVGDDPSRDGLHDTPERVVCAFEEFFSGYRKDVTQTVTSVEEVEKYDDIVLALDIPFFSHCEHHMVPFVGRAHLAYFPAAGNTLALSKLVHIVDIFARQLQTQERLTAQIVSALDVSLRPRGIALMLEGEHQCMSLRGAKKHRASTVTTKFTGAFCDSTEQLRFLTLARSSPLGKSYAV